MSLYYKSNINFVMLHFFHVHPNYESSHIQLLEGENSTLLNIPTIPCGLSSYYQRVQCGSKGSIREQTCDSVITGCILTI